MDQINIDKWAMMVRGFYSDSATSVATLGILNRCLRIGKPDTDMGLEAIVQPINIPYHIRSLLELMDESGYCLHRAGLSTAGTSSQPISELNLPDNKALNMKLMNYRITTLADLMTISSEGNNWNRYLCN